MRVVVDASVAVKWVLHEEWSSEAAGLLKNCLDLCAPDHMVAEIANVLWKYARRGGITGEEAIRRCQFLGAMPVELIPAGDLLSLAMRISCEWEVAVYDALYVALASRSGSRIVTVDNPLLRKLGSTPYAALLIHLRDFSGH